MFVWNVKLNSKSIVKFALIIISIIVVLFFLISLYKILSSNFKVEDEPIEPDVAYINSNEYTNILKCVYEDLNTYLGQKICFTGYVYRNLDFPENEFVLARDMTVQGSSKTLIVGFLCSNKDAKNFADGSWVRIIGEISKGNYHGEIPIIKITKIENTEKPTQDELVPPPDATYIPTGIIY